jgi:hypothetical protein
VLQNYRLEIWKCLVSLDLTKFPTIWAFADEKPGWRSATACVVMSGSGQKSLNKMHISGD